MRLSAIIGAAIAAISCAGLAHPHDDAPQDRQPESSEILVIVAHPDDELFIAPAIAAETRRGAQVTIVYATDGDAGPGLSDHAPGEALAAVRRAEAQCAVRALGAASLHLALGDGTLTAAPRRGDSPAREFLIRIRGIIDRHRPRTIITWGPDGGYGHGDHRMVSALVTEAVQARDASQRPALLYSAIPAGRMPDETPFGRWGETDPALLGARIAFDNADLARASDAAQCHETQFDAAQRAAMMPFLEAAVWRGEVAFRKAL